MALADAKAAAGAVTINYGLFINSVVSFVIVAFCVFMLIRTMNVSSGGSRAAGRSDHSRLPVLLFGHSAQG